VGLPRSAARGPAAAWLGSGRGTTGAVGAYSGKAGTMMAPWHLGTTKLDRRVAKAVARNASPAIEVPSRLLTWVADEHVLLAISAGLWLAAHAGANRERQQTDHLMLSVVATSILPHLLKRLIDQERPDRRVVHGRRHGIPRSGKPYDAFPSGHAMHVGAVASAVSWAFPKSAPIAWALGGLVAATRIVLLAHWMTDVLAGLTIGALVERCLRPLSGSTIRPDGLSPQLDDFRHGGFLPAEEMRGETRTRGPT
jgi:membrane-associated phospholipid phosphatase